MKFALLLPTILLTSCLYPDPAPIFTLSPVTQTGANTMGFRINGRVWQNFGRGCTYLGCQDNELRPYYSSRYNGFDISADLNSKDYDESFGLGIDSIKGVGTYLSGKGSVGFRNRINSLFLSTRRKNNIKVQI